MSDCANHYPPCPPPSPLPTPTSSHTAVPHAGPPPTANTGGDLFVPVLLLAGTLIVAMISLAISRGFRLERRP